MAIPKDAMELILGSLMVQASLYRFLVKEKIVDRDRLLAFFEERGQSWGKTASDLALLPLSTVAAILGATEEPAFPQTLH
jgi:hypothetical protein